MKGEWRKTENGSEEKMAEEEQMKREKNEVKNEKDYSDWCL